MTEYIERVMRDLGHTEKLSAEDIDAAFKEFDKDGNESISKGEMVAFVRSLLAE